MSWPLRPLPPLDTPPGRGRTIFCPSPGGDAVLSAAVLPFPGRRPVQIQFFSLKPTTPSRRGGLAVSRQYRNSVTLSGLPPPVPVPLPNVPSPPALSEYCRPLPASHHPLRLMPSRGLEIPSLPPSVSHRPGTPSPSFSASPPPPAVFSCAPSLSCTGFVEPFKTMLTNFGSKSKPTTAKNPTENAIYEQMHHTVANIHREIKANIVDEDEA